MIKVTLNKTDGKLHGFTVKNHGESIVCSAVSMLTINTINAIESFTSADFSCDYDENGGYIKFVLNKPDENTLLLLRTMELGLQSADEMYPGEMKIKEEF